MPKKLKCHVESLYLDNKIIKRRIRWLLWVCFRSYAKVQKNWTIQIHLTKNIVSLIFGDSLIKNLTLKRMRKKGWVSRSKIGLCSHANRITQRRISI